MKEKEYYDFLVEQMKENPEFRECFEKMEKQIPVNALPWAQNYYDCKIKDPISGALYIMYSEYGPESKIISLEKDKNIYDMNLYRCSSQCITEKQKLDMDRSGVLCARFEYKKEGDQWSRLIILFDLIKYQNDIYLMSTMHKKEFEDDINDKSYVSMISYYKLDKNKVEEFLTTETLNI